MRTIGVVIAVVAVGIFIGIIATADYGDFVKERELRNLELSYYELQQKIKQCEDLSGYSQDTCKEELKRMEKIPYFKAMSFGIHMNNNFRIVVKPG